MSAADVKMNAEVNSIEGTVAVPAPLCVASDLKRIMTDLSNQIADADRRHSEALTLMQQRLGVLGNTTQELREQLPLEQTSVLDRIEESMTELSNRIADTDAQRRNHIPEDQTASRQASSTDAAPALRSALAAGALDAYVRRPASSGASRPTVVDNFDMLDSTPHADDDPIDREAADALARLYETGTDDAGVPALDAVTAAANQPDHIDEVAFSPDPPASHPKIVAEITPEVAAVEPKLVDDDRAWLTERFADVAAKLEQSLSGARGHDSLDAFEQRFTTLEQRLTQAMSQAANSSDFTSLKTIESHVEDLNAQLVAVQTHFSRLDSIELELRSLADRLSTDELSKLIQNNAPKSSENDFLAGSAANGMAQQLPRIEQTLQSIASQLSADKIAGFVAQARQPAPDTGAIARMVANEISQLMPARATQHADPSDRLDNLKATLDAFVAERRHGDEQTNTMLDTMQQAMIRLLDRMDAIEQGRDLATEDDEHDEDRRAAHRQSYEDTYPHAQQTAAPQANSQIPEQATAPEQHRQNEIRELEARIAAAPISASGLRPGTQQVEPVEPALAAAAPSADSANNRESFIAAARRAARMAAEAPPEQEVTADLAGAPAKTRSPAKPASGSRKLSTVSMALICLLLVGASFVAVRMTILAPNPLPAVQSTSPQSASPPNDADKRIQTLEDADGANPVPQRRSSIQQGDENGVSGQPANGGVMPQLPGFPTLPAALTKDAAAENLTPRSNDTLPLSIGPNSLRAAAAKGDPSAEFEIGARFAEGRGVPQDLQQAVSWYQRAAAQGFAPAQYRLGSMFERGLGVKTDLAKARVWYQRAADQGIVKAMHNLAVLTAGRDTALTDYATAGKWFRAASEYGLTDSQFNLAIMHDSGLGMERDAKQAFKWFSLAARAGDEEAARRRESLRQKLQPQEVSEIETELANWRPKSADQAVNDPRMAGEAWKKSTR